MKDQDQSRLITGLILIIITAIFMLFNVGTNSFKITLGVIGIIFIIFFKFKIFK